MAKVEISAFCAGIIIGAIVASLFLIFVSVADEKQKSKSKQSNYDCQNTCEVIKQYVADVHNSDSELEFYKSYSAELARQNRELLSIINKEKEKE